MWFRRQIVFTRAPTNDKHHPQIPQILADLQQPVPNRRKSKSADDRFFSIFSFTHPIPFQLLPNPVVLVFLGVLKASPTCARQPLRHRPKPAADSTVPWTAATCRRNLPRSSPPPATFWGKGTSISWLAPPCQRTCKTACRSGACLSMVTSLIRRRNTRNFWQPRPRRRSWGRSIVRRKRRTFGHSLKVGDFFFSRTRRIVSLNPWLPSGFLEDAGTVESSRPFKFPR
jgi:hypothetical protein